MYATVTVVVKSEEMLDEVMQRLQDILDSWQVPDQLLIEAVTF